MPDSVEPRDPSGLPVVDLEMLCTCSDEGKAEAAAVHAALDPIARDVLSGPLTDGPDWINDFTYVLSDAVNGHIHTILTDQWHLVAVKIRLKPKDGESLGEELIVRTQCDNVRDGLAAVLLHAKKLREG